MKKECVIVLLLVLGSFGVFATGDEGVIINNYYDCGTSDGVCPDLYGAQCIEQDTDCLDDDDNIFWSNSEYGISMLETSVAPGTTKVYMNYYDEGLVENDEVIFKIRESNTGSDDEIREIEVTVLEDGKVSTIWEISQADLDKTPGDYDKFYFKVKDGDAWSEKSGYLELIKSGTNYCNVIDYCGDYNEEAYCEADNTTCKVSSSICPLGSVCNCYWHKEVGEPGKCGLKVGACEYEISSEGDCLTSSDSMIIRYTATGSGCEEIQDEVIDCSNVVQLPFFNWISFSICFLLISLVYAFLINGKRE